ncbi:hypothetical protein C9446_16285 [Providencia heimbachae]|uniref:Uncharacterized protein n=1 Tax=Providencia heimbachae ATCC 35613 TaxID=1354272 RepID=A0A1B7JYF5_9GAMM|nr:hypothetical protein M998_1360 [Providencia heimbachae ATCC 35613]QCJ71261.1 hypothetical protein C9446_16285 [Providencia heimbachae]
MFLVNLLILNIFYIFISVMNNPVLKCEFLIINRVVFLIQSMLNRFYYQIYKKNTAILFPVDKDQMIKIKEE